MTRYFLATCVALFSIQSFAKDMGFRYVNGACVDDKGTVGMNTGYIGQCADLQHVTMGSFDFSDADLSGSKFDESDLQSAIFNGSNLTGVSFASANLSGAEFNNALGGNVNFQKAILINAQIGSATFKNLDLRGADLSSSLLSFMSFVGSKLAGANFTNARLDHADLTGVDLTQAIFISGRLMNATLDGARLSGVSFLRADLTHASLKGVSGAGAIFRYAILRQTDFTGANVTGSDCFAAQMDSAILNQGVFDNDDFRGAVLKGAATDKASLKGAQFSKHTVLPFTAAVAQTMGMVLSKSGSLLVILDSDNDSVKTDVNTLSAALTEQGIDVTISPQSHVQFDGTETLTDYTSILHITGTDFGDDMPQAGQKALVDFVTNGGTYIATQYSGYMIDNNGELAGLREILMIGYTNLNRDPKAYTAVDNKSAHPLLYNVQPFTLTADHSLAPLHSFATNPAYTVMQDADGNPMVAAREVGKGKAVGLAFVANDQFPVFVNPSVQQLIQNAVFW